MISDAALRGPKGGSECTRERLDDICSRTTSILFRYLSSSRIPINHITPVFSIIQFHSPPHSCHCFQVPTCHMVHSALERIRTHILRSGFLHWVTKKSQCENARSDAAVVCAIGVVRAVYATLVSHAPDILHPIRHGDWDRE